MTGMEKLMGPKKRYRVKFKGRPAGAIGKTYPIETKVFSAYNLNEEGVKSHAYMLYEHITGFEVTEWPDDHPIHEEGGSE